MKKFCVNSICLILLLSFTGCAQNNSLQQKYGYDSSYFMALISLKSGDKKTAERFLKDAEKKASPLIARRSMEKQAELGNVQERIEKSLELYKRFPDENSLLTAAKELFENKEYASLIRLTEGIDLKNCSNETAFYRLYSMYKKKDSRFQNDFLEWCVNRSFQEFHYRLYCEVYEEIQNKDILEFRADIFTRNYAGAFANVKTILEKNDNRLPQILSDAGKALLYGSSDFFSNAVYLDSIRNSVPDNCKFYVDFYAGRLYDRADDYRTRALNRLLSAMEESETAEDSDNALWYYLNTVLKISVTRAIESIEKYREQWNDALYFDDFFETLSVRLLSLHSWEDFFKTADLIHGYASPETSAKFSYISARLIQENFIRLPKEKAAEETERLFRQALESGTDLYYRFLSMEKLNLDSEAIENNLFSVGIKNNTEPDKDAENLILGYADFGLHEFIYDEYQKSQEKIGMECAVKTADFLSKCGEQQQSIRIAARRFFSPDKTVPRELSELAFPRYFSESVEKYCKDFSQPEYLLYGLIRSESFFDPEAVSHAGAAGLTQLMETTAADVARKLKVAQYDLKDSETNIRFGSFYLEELRRRLDGSSILAVLSYNGGISRVRSWIKSARLEFGTENLPKDIFLEAIPFAETREYGRKVLSAAAMYGYLYYNLSPSEVVEEIMK